MAKFMIYVTETVYYEGVVVEADSLDEAKHVALGMDREDIASVDEIADVADGEESGIVDVADGEESGIVD